MKREDKAEGVAQTHHSKDPCRTTMSALAYPSKLERFKWSKVVLFITIIKNTRFLE
jgi:hypothetical protein